jgi:hypothetical protein
MIPTVLRSSCGVPGSVRDRGHASRRLSALTADLSHSGLGTVWCSGHAYLVVLRTL